MPLSLLALLWVLWCALHSLLVARATVRWVEQRWFGSRRWYRLCYNTVSLVTLVPLALATRSLPGEAVLSWQGGLATMPRLALLLVAFALFWGGAQRYDFATFLGLRQLRQGQTALLLGEDRTFVASGVFALTRHPWYLGSFLLLWTLFPAYPPPLLLAVAILSGYLLLGSWLEEQKILAEHGDSYRAYQNRVSMFFPWKWLLGRLRRGRVG